MIAHELKQTIVANESRFFVFHLWPPNNGLPIQTAQSNYVRIVALRMLFLDGTLMQGTEVIRHRDCFVEMPTR